MAEEKLARKFLQRQGLRFITANFHSRYGEIDLIMREQSTLVFVEVRSRAYSDFGSSADSIDWRKQQKISKTACYYLQKYPEKCYDGCRFDVIAIDQAKATKPSINWIKNAFESSLA